MILVPLMFLVISAICGAVLYYVTQSEEDDVW